MRSPVLYFFLLMLKVLFNLILDAVYKRSRFSKAFSEEGLKLVPGRGSSLITLNLGLMLLPAEVDCFFEKLDYKKDAFMTLASSNFEMVLVLSRKVVIFYISVSKV